MSISYRDPEAISKEMQAAMQQKTMMEQGVAGRTAPMGAPMQSQNKQSPSPPQNPGVPI